jgi:hypothetical protein
MKKKLIICTTAITRGLYHRDSIELIYVILNKYLSNYEVIHIVNIDQPTKLINHFSISQTIELLNNIIPKNITKVIIENKLPSFLSAFKNIMHKIEELNLNSEDNIFWWLEDDWQPRRDYNINNFLELLFLKNSALNFSEKSNLGSFRAGPLMSGSYFVNYFNIEKIGVMNQTCDPEKQVVRWLSGIRKKNGNQMIERVIENNDTIQIVFVFLGKEEIQPKEIPFNYYKNKLIFNENIIFEFHVIKADLDFNNLCHSQINPLDQKYNLTSISKTDLFNKFNNDNITYFTIKPKIFEDIGRIFSNKFDLKKWATVNDKTTYL